MDSGQNPNKQNQPYRVSLVCGCDKKDMKKMETITSGLPPISLPLYPLTPKLNSNPNFTLTTLSLSLFPYLYFYHLYISISIFLRIFTIDPFYSTSTISLSSIISFSLFSTSRSSHLVRVYIFSFLRRSVEYQFAPVHQDGFTFNLLHYIVSCGLHPSVMDEFGGPRFEGTGNTFRRKRTQTCRRPKPEVQALPENHDQASLSSTPPSDDAGKISSDENAVGANPKRKVFNLNQCATRTEGEYSRKRVQMDDGRYSNALHSNGGSNDTNEEAQSGLNHQQHSNSRVPDDGVGNENKLKKVKLKVGGVTRTIQPKSNFATSKNPGSSDAPRPRPKLILQDNSDEDDSPSLGKKIGLQGIPWKDFSKGGFSLGRESASIGKNSGGKQGEKSDRSRKSKRVPKRRVLDGDFDEEEDDEIRYLVKLKTVRVAAASRDNDDDSSKKHKSLSRVSKEDPGPLRSGRDSVSVDTDYEEEDPVSDHEDEGNDRKKSRKDSPDSPNETKRETTLTSRQRALLSGRDSASTATQIEFPNGLPPAPPRKQKEKLTEVEQQLKKAEAAERRRIQNEKAARESEAEAIRKILGQDSSRKKREDKLKKRQEELAQEKAANAKTLAPNTIRTVIGPTGTTVAFAEDIGLPHIFDPKPTSYPPPREKCAGPSCTNPYKYRDSKSSLPLCSLQCYKAINGRMQAETGC